MRKLSLGFVLLFLLQLGVSAPKSPVESKRSSPSLKAPKTQRSVSVLATPQGLGDQIVKFFGRKTGKELMAGGTGNMAGAGASATQALVGKSSARAARVTPVRQGYVPPPPTPRVSVSQIRQEIQKIFELNKKIKNMQNGGSAQLQRVQEQARIHQKILDELENTQKQTDGQKASAKNALLAQEKLRIIHEETQRNTQAIEDLKADSASPGSKVTPKAAPKVTPKAKTSAF